MLPGFTFITQFSFMFYVLESLILLFLFLFLQTHFLLFVRQHTWVQTFACDCLRQMQNNVGKIDDQISVIETIYDNIIYTLPEDAHKLQSFCELNFQVFI